MRRTLAVFCLTLAAAGSGLALASQGARVSEPKREERPPGVMCADCPMCRAMMAGQPAASGGQGMQAGGMGMMGMMGGGAGSAQVAPGSVTVGNDGTIYVLRGGTLYKYSPALKLLGKVVLPEKAAPGRPAAEGHEGHH